MRVRLELTPLTAFGSSISGDTLFGQLCWAVRWLYGVDRLNELLDGYTQNQPFAVVSDAFPHNHVPLPTLPSFLWNQDEPADRKYLKAKRWVDLQTVRDLPIARWRYAAKTNAELANSTGVASSICSAVHHNTISRMTSTTGEGQFAPYTSDVLWSGRDCVWDVYVETDGRLGREELAQCLALIGDSGYGRDASIGLGKFAVCDIDSEPDVQSVDYVMTLASCDLSGMPVKEGSYYRVKTHFGRHGDMMVHSGNPFKRPLLLAQTGAVLRLSQTLTQGFVGSGIAGVSWVQAECVHQGYAPILPIHG